MSYFPTIGNIPFEGVESKNPLAFHYYDAERVVMGKPMKDWFKFAMAWWHTLGQASADPFGGQTRSYEWDKGECPYCRARQKADAGFEIMEKMGIPVKMIHAGKANMFLSPIFRDTLAGVSGATIELYDTDGSVGAAKGAGIGAGIYRDNNEAFATLEKLAVITPQHEDEYKEAYENWKSNL